MSEKGTIGISFSGKGTVYTDRKKAEEKLEAKNEWSKVKGYGTYELLELEVKE